MCVCVCERVCVSVSVCLLANRAACVFHWIRCNHCIAMHGKSAHRDDIRTQCPSPRQPVATGTAHWADQWHRPMFRPFFSRNCHPGPTSLLEEGTGLGVARLLPLTPHPLFSVSEHSSSSQQCPLVSDPHNQRARPPVWNLLFAFVLLFFF